MADRPVVEYTAHITPSTPLLPALRAWELYLADQGRSIYTVKAFLGDVQLLANYLAPDRNLGSITTRDLNAFLEWLQAGRGVPCSPKSLARRITSVKAFFRWLQRGGVLALDPAEKVLQKSVISPLPELLTASELKKVLDVANAHRTIRKPDARPYTLVALLLATGIKKGECLTIHVNHIDTRSVKSPSPKTGCRFIRNIWPNINRRIRFSPGLPGGWNICWKIWERKPD
jgi:site-specific recombinase XerD